MDTVKIVVELMVAAEHWAEELDKQARIACCEALKLVYQQERDSILRAVVWLRSHAWELIDLGEGQA